MTLPVALGMLLLLPVFIHSDRNLLIDCSDSWLQVRVRRVPILDLLLPQPYELYLGTRCPVTSIEPGFFEFHYDVLSCGIIKHEHVWGIAIESSVTYEPVRLRLSGEHPILCTVTRVLRPNLAQMWEVNSSSTSEETAQPSEASSSNHSSPEECLTETCPDVAAGSSLSLLKMPTIHVEFHCSLDWVMVYIAPYSLSRLDLYIFHDELVLGLGCPVTHVHTYRYDFIYPVSACGIRTQVTGEDTLLIHTELHFIPHSSGRGDPENIPLVCATSRKSVWLTPVSTVDEIKLGPSPFMADFGTTLGRVGVILLRQAPAYRKRGTQSGE